MKLVLTCGGCLALGSFLLLALAACGSAGSDPIPPSPVATTRPPSRGSSSGSTGFPQPPEPEPEPFDCPQDFPLSESDLDKEIGWKPGAPAQGSCSETDLQTIDANFANANLRTYVDLAKGLSTTCRACVLSKDTDATWGPIVATAENDGETGFINYGACFGAIEGAACGKAIQYESFCQSVACNECAFTTQERAECITTANGAGGMCAPFASKKTTACPSWTLNVKSCGDIKKAIETLCGTPP